MALRDHRRVQELLAIGVYSQDAFLNFLVEMFEITIQTIQQGEQFDMGVIQDHIDGVVAAFKTDFDAIEKEISDLKAQPGAEVVDFTALDATVARANSDAGAGTVAATTPPAPVAAAVAAADATPAASSSAATGAGSSGAGSTAPIA